MSVYLDTSDITQIKMYSLKRIRVPSQVSINLS